MSNLAAAPSNEGSFKASAIRIAIAYGWREFDGNPDGLNSHWDFLKKSVESVVSELEKRALKRQKPSRPLRVSVGRLRGRHGGSITGAIFKRIQQADVLVFDVSGNNPNVHFELGCAAAIKGIDSGRIFIFCQTGSQEVVSNQEVFRPASDLSGFLFTRYLLNSKSAEQSLSYAKLQDTAGFKAALRSTLIEIACEKEMWGASKETIDSDGEEEGALADAD
jgi:hypothetical protein